MTPSDETKLSAMRDYIVKLANATSSFASRLNYEPDTGKSLKVTGDIVLQNLGVVPQTVFLKTRHTEIHPRSARLPSSLGSRRSQTASSARTPILSPRGGHRSSTGEVSSTGAPFEDLRRRLVTLNGSNPSVGSHGNKSRDIRHALSPVAGSSTTSLSAGQSPSISDKPDRPASPTESIVSTTNSVSLRPASRLHVGSTDGQKAAPAVGSSKTNVTGLLDAHFMLKSEGSPDESGRSSPISMSTTLRAGRLARPPSSLAISTYGKPKSSSVSLCIRLIKHLDGQEPGISNLLENLYLDNNTELQNDFGPKVHEGPVRRRNITRPNFSRDAANKRMEASLIANLSSHSEAITGLAVAPDHSFFVSASDDKTVKVWDTARLERNVTSKPRHTYGQHHARVKSICMLEGVHCFASAADDGSLHVVRVHLTQTGTLPKYSKLQVIREHRVENAGEYITCMTHFNTGKATFFF